MVNWRLCTENTKFASRSHKSPLSGTGRRKYFVNLLTVLFTGVLLFFFASGPRISRTGLRPSVTVVTAYYAFPSKHTQQEYATWITNFLSHIPCNLYIYTDAESLPFLRRLRSLYMNTTRFIVKPFNELDMSRKRNRFWRKQFEMDTEWRKHSEKLYIIWNEKTKFMMDAIAKNAFASDYFVWCDIGSFRNISHIPHLRTFPNVQKFTRLNPDEVYLTEMDKFLKSDFHVGRDSLPVHRFHRDVRVGASLFVGHRRAWEAWSTVYYDVMDRLVRAGRFVGKDQTVMANIVALKPGLVKLIRPKSYFNGSGDGWFYFQYYFS